MPLPSTGGSLAVAANSHLCPRLCMSFFSFPCCVLSRFNCVQLFCDPMDHGPPGSSVHGILQIRRLEWVALPSSRGSPQPRD